jgi:hypothetical protein
VIIFLQQSLFPVIREQNIFHCEHGSSLAGTTDRDYYSAGNEWSTSFTLKRDLTTVRREFSDIEGPYSLFAPRWRHEHIRADDDDTIISERMMTTQTLVQAASETGT